MTAAPEGSPLPSRQELPLAPSPEGGHPVLVHVTRSRARAAGLAAGSVMGALAAVAVFTAQNDAPDSSPAITGPAGEFGARMADCLNAKGWDATAAPNNSFSVGADAGERAQLARDKQACGEQLGYDIY
jgi:hypothetical protein